MKGLESWVQRPHLTDDRLQAYREAFNCHPSRLLVIKDFLELKVAERLSRFLAEEAVFQAEYGLYSSEPAVSEPEFRAAKDSDRFFRLSKLTGTNPQFRISPNAITYLQFRQSFQRPDFQIFFEKISGMSLGWSDDF